MQLADRQGAQRVRFPDHEAFGGGHRPARIECDIYDLEIDGIVPAELNGTWYRLGPDTQYPPFIPDDIWINGDGFMSAFRFENGHVDLKSRYVRTERFIAERTARRALFGRYRNGYTDDPSVRGKVRSTANTTPIFHAGHLLALKEDGRPIELDPTTLDTLGEYDWNGKLRSKTVTAHPKIDHATGEMLFFSYEAEGDGSSAMAFCVADKGGTLVREEWFEPPYVAMVHDFAITTDYVIFPLFPTTMDVDRLKSGGSHWAFDRRLDTMIGIMPRSGSVKDLRWFRRPACHAYHMINAYDEKGIVHLDLVVSDINSFPFIPDIDGAPWDPAKVESAPTRWTFDMNAKGDTFREAPLGGAGELPRIDDRLTGLDYRYGYLMSFAPPLAPGPPIGTVGRIDVKDCTTVQWADTNGGNYQEPQFVPNSANFDAGYVLDIVDYPGSGRGELHIFAADAIAEGPLARVHIPMHQRTAIHTMWLPAP